jgi:serine/threonine protein kinase
MNFADFVGQTLDDKYKIERELGRGGMGTVYLATHLGTERPVAVKIIAPQFMQRAEFVERFRREARAAGRLRHPNVVDVTDFGFSNTGNGQVAYLVMEYLDGCTLGEILEEEKNLPVGWTLDILEQVCSAVHEAHEQGIIHRDLKPDNIWLEPNQRGGYTVKVLDFGIAKLEEHMVADGAAALPGIAAVPTRIDGARETVAFIDESGTAIDGVVATRFGEKATIVQGAEHGTLAGESATMALESSTMAREAGTLIQNAEMDGKKTAILAPLAGSGTGDAGTRLITPETEERMAAQSSTAGKSLFAAPDTSDLTRVGAVLGTPLYMSPEQCRGEKLDARSDVYSLAVITYQMLGGRTPFEGDFKDVMEAHKNLPPPPLPVKTVRKKIKKLIYSAMSKDAGGRPPTAEAFASELRARSEGIGTLLRRALTLYSEHLPKFLGLALLLYIPAIIVTILNVTVNILYVTGTIGGTASMVFKGSFGLLSAITTFFCAHLIVGTTTWLVNQVHAYPLRPVRIRPAILATRKNWKKLIGTGVLATLTTIVGLVLCIGVGAVAAVLLTKLFGTGIVVIVIAFLVFVACVIPGLLLPVLLALVSPVVMMENLKGFAAFKRSKELVMRSMRTTIAGVLLMFLVPACLGGITGFLVAVTVKAFSPNEKIMIRNADGSLQPETPSKTTEAPAEDGENEDGVNINLGNGKGLRIDDQPAGSDDMMKRVRAVTQESSTAILMLPIQILIASLSAIIWALLYLKTRRAGGESMKDLMEKFEETEPPRKKWQERVRQRLIQSGRITSKPS